MSSSYLLDPFILTVLAKEGGAYLDIGCGKGKWGYLLKTSHKPPSYIVGGDIDLSNLRYAKKHKTYDDVVLLDGRHLPFRDDSFDIVLAIEVIEHMEKIEGQKLLDEAERVSRESYSVNSSPWG